jgi:predicted metal-dependent hydrolase
MTLQVANIECQVVRSGRRSTAIYIERDGSVLVRAPAAIDDAKLSKLVEKKLPWIYRNLALWNELNQDTPRREFVSGETFYIEGQPCILDVRADAQEALVLTGDRLVLRKSDRPKAQELMQAMYRKRGYERLPGLIDHFARQMGVEPGRLRVWELMNRWASCSSAGNLNFHWRAMALPLDVLEYLVVHELAHLKHRNHTKDFWLTVEKASPKWQHAAEWLRVYGAGRSL